MMRRLLAVIAAAVVLGACSRPVGGDVPYVPASGRVEPWLGHLRASKTLTGTHPVIGPPTIVGDRIS